MIPREKILPLSFLALLTFLCVWAVANSKILWMDTAAALQYEQRIQTPTTYANSNGILE